MQTFREEHIRRRLFMNFLNCVYLCVEQMLKVLEIFFNKRLLNETFKLKNETSVL